MVMGVLLGPSDDLLVRLGSLLSLGLHLMRLDVLLL